MTKDIKMETDVSDIELKSDLMKAFLEQKQDELLEGKGK